MASSDLGTKRYVIWDVYSIWHICEATELQSEYDPRSRSHSQNKLNYGHDQGMYKQYIWLKFWSLSE